MSEAAGESGFRWAAPVAGRALPPGEQVLVAVRPARRSIVLRSLPTLGWCAALAALALVARPWIAPWHLWVYWGAAGVLAARIGWETLVRQSRLFACSQRRVVARFGVLSRNAIDLPWDRVQQVIVRRTLLERLFGLGTLGFSTASGGVDLAWVGVARAWALHATVRGHVPGGTPPVGQVGGGAPEPRRARPLVIGLAGGIGAGKSAAARALEALGCIVSDSDAESRRELQHPDVREQLRAWWGERIFGADGAVDRAAVAAIVFGDPAERAKLEGLIHPRLKASRERLKAEAHVKGAPAVVIDAPLLFEAGLHGECDAVMFVDAPRAERLARVARSRGWTEEELARREAAQMPVEEKKRRSDVVIENDGDEARLRERVAEALRALLAQGARRVDMRA